MQISLTRDQLQQICQPVLDRINVLITTAISSIPANEPWDVEVSGGAIRMPLVQELCLQVWTLNTNICFSLIYICMFVRM